MLSISPTNMLSAIACPKKLATHFILTILNLLLLSSIHTITCSPPDNPIKCSSHSKTCTITNAYGIFPDRTVCHAANATFPKSEQELIWIVANATFAKRKIKVTTQFSHSITKLICPDGNDGVLISTTYLNRILNIDHQSMTITLESGVSLKQLIEEAAKAGLALPYTPYWWGLTVGGMLGTGAHGSTLWGKGSAVHDHVVQVKMVSPGGVGDNYVKVRTLDGTNNDLDAAKTSLGVLGVISQITLKLQPLFKRSITFSMKDDTDLADEATRFGYTHEFGDIIWYPSQRKVLYRIDDRVPNNLTGNGVNDFIPFRATSSLALSIIRVSEEIQEIMRDTDGKCLGANAIKATLLAAAFGFTNDGVIFTGYPVVGYHNKLQSSGSCHDSIEDLLITACPWDSRVSGEFYHQTSISVGLSVVKSFIQDIQKLVTLAPKSLCGLELYNGILIRYVTASNAYLGKQEDGLDFDFTYYRSKDPLIPRLYEDVIEEIEQMALFKYGGLPHWGKNRNIAFIEAIKKYKKAEEFLRVKEDYDPLGLFSSEWTNQVLGLEEGLTIDKEGCALEGLCICSKDIHCAPQKGYFCREGKIYKLARVCTLVISSYS